MDESLRVLLIEDSEDDAALVLRQLRQGGYEPIHQRVQTANDVTRALASQEWDIVISDYAMPQFSGLDALTIVRRENPELPFILVSGTIGEETAVTALKMGANDYLMKQALARLAPSVRKEIHETKARRIAEAHKAAILESALDCIITMDHEGKVTQFNPAAEKTFGYKREDVIGKELAELIIPPAMREAHRQGLETYRKTGVGPVLGQRIEVDAMRADGTEFPVELAITRISLSDPPAFSAYLRDITQRKQAEEQLRKARADLETRVEQRTAELARTNETLQLEVAERKRAEAEAQNAKALAESANRAKSDFLANMSHEIRTPLNGVLGVADLMLATELDGRQERYAQLIKTSAEALTEILNDVLDFSKIEAQKIELESEEFQLHIVIEDIVEMMSRKASQKGLELCCHFDDVPPVVKGDAGRVRQVLVNLINNAIKFTETGGITIKVGHEKLSDGDVLLRISVRDTGVGIPANRVDRLFKSFSQVDASTTRKYGGTGLGLAISKSLCHLMGGQIGVESTEGSGSTFWFTVKLIEVSRAQPEHAVPSIRPQDLRVLAVDDSATQRETLRKQISTWGMTGQTVSSGDEALASLREASAKGQAYHVGILDAEMPNMDGIALAKAIRQDEKLRETPLILLLSMETQPDDAALKQVGISTSLTKPIRQSLLYDAIVNAVSSTALQAVDERPRLKRAARSTAGSTSKRLRVLLAEDNKVNQLVAADTLRLAGHDCDVVGDGKQAVDAVFSRAYDVVLMDCQMPRMDGFEASAAIRKREQIESRNGAARHVPIVALTANALSGDRERCLAAGMDAYLSKPFTTASLLDALANLPELREAAPPTSPPVQIAPPASSLDVSALLARFSNNLSLGRMVLEEFQRQAANDLLQLRQQLEARNLVALSQVAHSLKGAAGLLTATRVETLAADLEKAGRQDDVKGVIALCEQLDQELTKCINDLPNVLLKLADNSKETPVNTGV